MGYSPHRYVIPDEAPGAAAQLTGEPMSIVLLFALFMLVVFPAAPVEQIAVIPMPDRLNYRGFCCYMRKRREKGATETAWPKLLTGRA